MLSRRNFAVLTGAASVGFFSTQPANSRGVPRVRYSVGEIQDFENIVSDANGLGFKIPTSASTSGSVDALTLAEIVVRSIEATDSEGAENLARRAGLFLSVINRKRRDALQEAVDGATPAAAYRLTPQLAKEYADTFRSAQIKPSARGELNRAAKLIASQSFRVRYQELEAQTGIPWYVIGALHYREASLNFMGHLHNGDPLLLRTVNVPPNRPPKPWPPAGITDARLLWKLSAQDALSDYSAVKNWTLEAMCFTFERYNGFGLRMRGLKSPYLWNYTNHYVRGGFPRDRVFDPNYVSKQAGVIALLLALQSIDTSVQIRIASS